MTDELRPLDEHGFGARVEPHRRELQVTDGGITEIITFDRAVFRHFDLPATLDAAVSAR